MNGMFHRLANQAISKAKPVIRPLARMRYASPLELMEPETEHLIGDHWPPRDEDSTTAPRRHPMPATPTTHPLDGAGAVEPVADHRTADRVATPERVESENRVPIAEDWLPTEIEPHPERPEPKPAHAADFLATEAGPKTVQTIRLVGVPSPPTRLVRSAGEPPPPSPRGSGTIGRGPLVSTREPDSEPTEVHVHIGRIEVTAVHEPAPPKRPRQPARKPMSLEEYLSTRGGKSG